MRQHLSCERYLDILKGKERRGRKRGKGRRKIQMDHQVGHMHKNYG